jgi:hypothetical protein
MQEHLGQFTLLIGRHDFHPTDDLHLALNRPQFVQRALPGYRDEDTLEEIPNALGWNQDHEPPLAPKVARNARCTLCRHGGFPQTTSNGNGEPLCVIVGPFPICA